MLAIKVLLELRDVITMREQQEGIVYVSSIKGRFKLYGTILQPFTLIIAHEGVSKYYSNNHFPSSIFWSTVKKFMNKVCNPPPPSMNVPKDRRYLSLPYLGHHSYVLRNKLQSVFRAYFPQINVQIILSNRTTIGSLFPVKERLPFTLRSNVIYEYKCEDCGSSYVGSTTRCLYERMCEHMGISFLTGRKVSKPRNSSIHDHSTKYSHNMNPNSFKIIGQANKYDNILLLESVHIKYNHPDLNDMYSSYPLHLT